MSTTQRKAWKGSHGVRRYGGGGTTGDGGADGDGEVSRSRKVISDPGNPESDNRGLSSAQRALDDQHRPQPQREPRRHCVLGEIPTGDVAPPLGGRRDLSHGALLGLVRASFLAGGHCNLHTPETLVWPLKAAAMSLLETGFLGAQDDSPRCGRGARLGTLGQRTAAVGGTRGRARVRGGADATVVGGQATPANIGRR